MTLPRSYWAGYIKDYEGATIMQCTMLPRIVYLQAGQLLLQQKMLILEKIRENSSSHIVHSGRDLFGERVDPSEVKALCAYIIALLCLFSSLLSIFHIDLTSVCSEYRRHWLDARYGCADSKTRARSTTRNHAPPLDGPPESSGFLGFLKTGQCRGSDGLLRHDQKSV